MPRDTQVRGQKDKGKSGASQRRQDSSQNVSQSRRRRDREESDDDDLEEEDSGTSDDGPSVSADIKAYDLVRMALFAENSKTSLKKDDINKKIIGSRARMVNYVFEEAQQILNQTFGLELVELMTRIERDQAASLDDVKGKKKGTSLSSETGSSKAYILRSTLPKALIEAAMEPSPIIREALLEQVEEEEDEENSAPLDDTLIAWRAADDPASIGILHVVLALIMVNGRSIPDPQLRAQLKQLKLHPGVPIPASAGATHKGNSIDVLLASFTKSGYLDRQRNPLAGGSAPGATQGRGRKRANDDDDGRVDDYEWKWGSRAFAEIGEVGVAEFIRDFMGERFSQRAIEGEEGSPREEGAKSKEQEKYEEVR
ncbi:MAGE family-domain-containing protein [Cantharellus anzutake]|uniref:MAGE family-domain-containing protein n=1 Tax=Cantharellus anzutake TaxID=1750568 RepID=UPI001902FA21|nr:MAGE family-domain-containing protein [Cantharellus anzutake]KAF8337373.1 MAGE family-domain-containing protein [Cantharellus anzutake]